LADAYLGYSMPIYWGCTNISDFFPKNAYISIDVTNIKSGLKKLEEIIHKDLTESQKDAISQARNMVLHKYNTFSILDSLASEQADETHETITLNPGKNIASQRAFTTKQKIRNLIRNGIHIPAK
jgi:CO dehydrogenase/acetyl-CoA synthase gamma subunit (corrinoid Fe-S protein)